MMSHISTPFKVLENPGDENDSSVMKISFKGSKTGDFARIGGLSSFSNVTKAGGLSSVVKSTRKPLLDLSKGQLNSRLSAASPRPLNSEKGVVRKPKEQIKRIPVIISNDASTLNHQSKKRATDHNSVDMICSGGRIHEDPYDLVMRKADAKKITIVPVSGSENEPVIDHLSEIQSYTDSIKFENKEYEINSSAYVDEDAFANYPDFLF